VREGGRKRGRWGAGGRERGRKGKFRWSGQPNAEIRGRRRRGVEGRKRGRQRAEDRRWWAAGVSKWQGKHRRRDARRKEFAPE